MELPTCTCTRCEIVWTPRTPDPKKCPACNSPYWNTPRSRQPGRVARPRTPCTCLRCGANWRPVEAHPKMCPKCRSRVWNKPPRGSISA